MVTGKLNTYRFAEWYIVEKETEKIIKKLYTLKELDYYLHNSDEFVRRLAIVRLSELKIKNSINILKDILEDQMESSTNKELAAWVIKKISHENDMDLFLNNKFLNKYSGIENFSDIYKVSINDLLPSIKFDFSSYLKQTELMLNKDDIRTTDDINFDMPFSIHEWMKACFENYNSKAIKFVSKIPLLLFMLLKKITKNILIKIPQLIMYLVKAIINCKPKFKNNKKGKESYYKRYYSQKPSMSAIIKNAIVKVLRFVFFPVRLVLKHRKLAFLSLIIAYCVLTFTNFGKTLTYKYWNVDIVQAQNNIYNTGKDLLTYAWSELKEIAGSDENHDKKSIMEEQSDSKSVSGIKYIVTANTGLNLRKFPDAGSEKASDKTLTNNDIVTYLMKSQKDSSGRLWHYIETDDGKTGWAYSKWLKEVKDK